MAEEENNSKVGSGMSVEVEVPGGNIEIGNVAPVSNEIVHIDAQTGEAMRQHFNLWATLGMNYSITGTPIAMGTVLAFVVGVGGSPVYVFGYIVAAVFQLLVCTSLAELAAAFPHSTGQVYWTSCVAPSQWARSLSYWCGAFTAAAWFCWTVGTFLFSSQLLFATASVSTDLEYQPQLWHQYMGFLAAAVLVVLLNVTFFAYYKHIMSFMVFYVNFVVLSTFITLLVRAHPKRSAYTVFVDVVNETGWTSDGWVFLLGLLPGITGINGFDAAAHVADELPNPARQVPQVMLGSAILSAVLALPMVITYMFCVVNEANLLTPVGNQPIIQLYLDSSNSKGLALFLSILLVVDFYIAGSSVTTASSRTLWSLAQANHTIGSKWLAKISSRHDIPRNSIYFIAVLASLLGLLVLGPTTVLNAILGAAAILFFLAYTIPIMCLVFSRKALRGRQRYLDLGHRFGPVVNILALAWMLLMSVVLCFPIYLPVTSTNMNYTIAVVGGVLLVYGTNWMLHARDSYQAPQPASIGLAPDMRLSANLPA